MAFMNQTENNLRAQGIVLSEPTIPVANYVPAVIAGDLIFISGQLAFSPDGTISPAHTGKVGVNVSLEDAQVASRLCAVNILSQLRYALGGDLERVRGCVRLGGFVNCVADFASVSQVINGASDVMVLAFGDKGRHARAAVGVAQLPLNSAVEVDAVFQIV
jgi:enamine deaminase RidA (YjgF/YER057c/UK114 family)